MGGIQIGKVVIKDWNKAVYDYYKQNPKSAPLTLQRYPITKERVDRFIEFQSRDTIKEHFVGFFKDIYYETKDYILEKLLRKNK